MKHLTEKEYRVLNTLASSGKSGKEIRLLMNWHICHASFYKLMRKIEDKKLVVGQLSSYVDKNGFSIREKHYRITDYGREKLNET